MSCEFIGKNTLERLPEILNAEKPRKILVFTGKKSFEKLKPEIEKTLQKFTNNITFFNDFSNNPKAKEVKAAGDKLGSDFDFIIAIGGGSVIDFAKLYKFSIENDSDIESFFKKPFACKKKRKMLAIPTTAGTGAENTRFAVVYIDGVKHSLDDDTILPDYKIADSNLVKAAPAYLKACCGADAFAQAVESFWAVGADETSRKYAEKAIILCKNHLKDFVLFDDDEAAQKITEASFLAGKAINISKTTAAHAISYPFTSVFSLPHGHAVALSLGKLAGYNFRHAEEFGVTPVMTRLSELLGTTDFAKYFKTFFDEIELETDFKKLGITDFSRILPLIDKGRLQNNPVKLRDDFFAELFGA